MKKLLNNPWIVGALAIAAIAFVTDSLLPKDAAPAAAAAPSEDEIDAPLPAPDAPAQPGSSLAEIRDALKELTVGGAARDPFVTRAKEPSPVPVVVEKTARPDSVETIRLTALWTQGGETLVLINGRICRAGDAIGRLTIDAATQDGVWVTHWKGRDFIELGSAFTLVTPAEPVAPL